MSPRAVCLVLLLAASCSTVPMAPPAATALAPPAPAAPGGCQVAANGGPIQADRGLGGTGIGAEESRLAERGIGGTGIALDIPHSEARGVTGGRPGAGSSGRSREARTPANVGVVGVITGFGSICIDGARIGLDGAVPVSIDGNAASGSALRAGQVAVIKAVSGDGPLRSLYLDVRHAVVGPIERADASANSMVIAGQAVLVPPSTWGAGAVEVGDWVAVGGLRRPDGSILATRLDMASKGMVSIRGRVVMAGGKPRIGSVSLLAPAGLPLTEGAFVAVSGRYTAGVLRVMRLEHDLLAQDPLTYFGQSVRRIVERSIVRIKPGRVLLNGVLPVPIAPGVVAPEGIAPGGIAQGGIAQGGIAQGGIAQGEAARGETVDLVVTLERGAGGAYGVTRLEPPPAAPPR